MKFLDFLLHMHKDGQPHEADTRAVEPPQLFQPPYALNKRRSIRYSVKGIPPNKIGTIVNISRSGCMIKKTTPDHIDFMHIIIRLGIIKITALIVWQDEDFSGVEFIGGYNDPGFISRHMMRIKDGKFSPLKNIRVETIIGFISRDPFSNMLNLIAEIESPNTDINRLKSLIIKLPDLAPAIVAKAGINKTEDEIGLRDVDQAVKRLGMDTVKKTSLEFIKINREKIESISPKNSLYESLKTVKKVFFDILAPYFGYTRNTGLVDNLAAVEYKGIDIITTNTEETPKIKEFYNSTQKIYSEMTRFCERLLIGRDLLNINRINIRIRKTLIELFDGYLLAHMILNPIYALDSYVEVSINKINLSFAYIAYLTFISAEAIIEKDAASVAVFKDRLHATGMDSTMLNSFVSMCVSEVNRTMADLGRSTKLKVPVSGKGFNFADYMSIKDIPQYGRFIKPFKELDIIKRMVIAYEDEAYTHFILGKILSGEDIGLHSKMFCVIPCENLSADEIIYDTFSFFGIVVLKNIAQIPKRHLKMFVKLWNHFDGILIVTFNKYSMVDFHCAELYTLLKESIIDFPSYFDNEKIYDKMIDHTAAYISPYIEGQLNVLKYKTEKYSMNTIRGCELLNTAPADTEYEKEDDEDNPLVG
ncbi:MAG: hypothetical protein HQK96_05795 [Nitrospirae bacterium]|nr:hypothetical protein [Nitrospirota bacterium]